MRTHTALALTLLTAACSQTPRDEARPLSGRVPPVQPVEGDGPDAPVLARWRTLDDSTATGVTAAPTGITLPTAGATLQLAARVEYHGVVEVPVTLDIRLPRGVMLAHGALHRTLPVAPPGTVYEEQLVLRVATPTADDLVMVIDARSAAWGVHGEVPYHFAPAVTAAVPTITQGAPVVLDGHVVGPTIRVTGR